VAAARAGQDGGFAGGVRGRWRGRARARVPPRSRRPPPPFSPCSGSDVFPAFAAFLKAPPGDPEGKEAALVAALRSLCAHLSTRGPWLGGAALGQADCALAPKLHHMQVALRHFKGWEAPAECAAVGAYLDAWRARPSWQAHAYTDAAIVAGWKRHMEHA